MESEKVKEIKELLRCMNGEKACTNCYINDIAQEQGTYCINVVADMTLDLINELESENERLSKELDSEWKDRRKAEEDLHKAQWNYKIGLGQSRKRNKELKDRIAELENKCDDCAGCTQWKCDCANIKVYELEQFAERLKEKVIRPCDLYDCVTVDDIDETLKEFINADK